MESVNVEVRQPYTLPANISVPVWQPLKGLQEKTKQFERESKDYAAQLQQLERESPSPEVKAARVRLEAKKAEAEFWRERTQDEYDQLTQQCAFKLFRRALLNQELAELPAADSPTLMRAYQPGEKPIRPRLEILSELSETITWLAWFSGDAALGQQAATLEAQLAEAYQTA